MTEWKSDTEKAREALDRWLAERLPNLSDDEARQLDDLIDDLQDAAHAAGADCANSW